jgi:hypothetical protein
MTIIYAFLVDIAWLLLNTVLVLFNTVLTFFIIVGTLSSTVFTFVSSLFNGGLVFAAGGGITSLAMAFGPTLYDDAPEAYLAMLKKWHGSIDDKLSNIMHVYDVLSDNPKPAWDIPTGLVAELKAHITALQALIAKCRDADATAKDRMERNTELKTTVSLCIVQIKIWALHAYTSGFMTIDELHRFGFILPGEGGGDHRRGAATDVKVEVKSSVLAANKILVVIDQAADKDVAKVVHGWPQGVRYALIVITTEDGTEVFHKVTTRLYNRIELPNDSHGKMFLVKASFLKHPDDTPYFSKTDSVTMPYLVEDIAKMLEKQHEEEVENHRLEVERLEAEIKALKGNK